VNKIMKIALCVIRQSFKNTQRNHWASLRSMKVSL
jgi:hypothetical protein